MSGEAVSGCLSREAVSVQGGRVCLPRETLFVSLSVQGGHVCLSAQGGRVCLSMEAVSVFVQGGRVYLLVQGGCVYQERPYLFREAVSACPGRPCLSVCLSVQRGRVCPARPWRLCLVQALPWPVCVSCRTADDISTAGLSPSCLQT